MTSKSGGGTTGFDYYMGIMMGVCRGPVDNLLEIKVGELTAWTGNITESGTFTINAAELFGGQTKEGGIQGDVQVFMGEPTQVMPQNVKDSLNGAGSYATPTDEGAPDGGASAPVGTVSPDIPGRGTESGDR